MTQEQLLEHLWHHDIDAHGRRLRKLVLLARRVEEMHGTHPEYPRGLPGTMAVLGLELDRHSEREDRVLAHREGAPCDARMARLLQAQHSRHGGLLDALRKATRDYTPPADACKGWRALYSLLEGIEHGVRERIRIENDYFASRYFGGSSVPTIR